MNTNLKLALLSAMCTSSALGCSASLFTKHPDTALTGVAPVATLAGSSLGDCCQACEHNTDCWAWSWQMVDKIVWRAVGDHDTLTSQQECILYGLGSTQFVNSAYTGTEQDALAMVDPALGEQEHVFSVQGSYSYMYPDCVPGLVFHCGAFRCLHVQNQCDGYEQCPGGQDEQGCYQEMVAYQTFGGVPLASSSQPQPGDSWWNCQLQCADSSMCEAWTHSDNTGACSLFYSQTTALQPLNAGAGVKSSMLQPNVHGVRMAAQCQVQQWSARFDKNHADNTLTVKIDTQDEHECCDACDSDPACVGFNYNFNNKKCAKFSAASAGAIIPSVGHQFAALVV